MVKWIAVFLGYFLFRFPGAVLGFFVGSFIDYLSKGSGSQFREVYGNATRKAASPADFELHLISLCAVVIKADGKVSQAELDYVRQYFVATYGKEKANAIFKTFNEVIKRKELSTQQVAAFFVSRTRYEVRLQLLHFLFGIAQSDGVAGADEIRQIAQIAGYLKVRRVDFDSIQAMFVKEADNAYKILEISKSVSDVEVKKAYRTMVKKYHPDKVITDNEAIKKGAEEKFKEVQKAYEQIQKERGL